MSGGNQETANFRPVTVGKFNKQHLHDTLHFAGLAAEVTALATRFVFVFDVVDAEEGEDGGCEKPSESGAAGGGEAFVALTLLN